MKNYIYIILSLTISLSAFGQKNLTVNYSVETSGDFFQKEENDLDDLDKKINEGIKNHISDFKFTLKINETESLFESVKTMSNDHNSFGYKITQSVIQSKKKFYANINTRESLTETESYGQKFIIVDTLRTSKDWVIGNETKKIGDYQCIKATTKKTVINTEGEFITDIVVWFAPEISFSFGPLGYGGLPGLILELQDDIFVYKVNELNYVENLKIKKPNSGKKVTKKEFLEIGLKAIENRF
jgi:GLPGLI family protein